MANQNTSVTQEPKPFMVKNRSYIDLTCTIDHGHLRTVYHADDQRDHRGPLLVRIAEGGTLDITLSPFEHDGQRFVIHVFSPGEHGTLLPWQEDEYGRPYRRVPSPAHLEFVVVAVSADGTQIFSDGYPLVDVDPMNQ